MEAPRVLKYGELNMDLVDDLFKREGVLYVSIPERHARACVELIETHRVFSNFGSTRPSVATRLGHLMRGLWLSLRLVVVYPRLTELLRVIILRSSAQSWSSAADGQVVFRFSR
jgi:hypothetical protein